MSELVSNVLDLTRLDSGEVALRRDWESLDDLAGAALHRSRSASRITRSSFAPGRPAAPCSSTPSLVVQVFANLFDNVAKYTPAGTRARGRAVADGAVRARDGRRRRPGLAAGRPGAAVRQVPARREERRRSASVSASRSAARSSTRTAARSTPARRPGGGARFEFTLPSTEPGVTEAMHQVLVVEDEPGIRRVLRVLLEAERYRVVEAETAARADIEARSHKPDLLLVDLGLPDATGSR